MSETGCPVCGYPEFTEQHPHGGSTYEICSCCGFGSGVDGIGWDREDRNNTFRQRWIEIDGARWWSHVRPPPPGWNASDQLRAAGFIDNDPDEEEAES
jgi:hypothetical protein